MQPSTAHANGISPIASHAAVALPAQRQPVLRRIDAAIASVLGADLRLIYGMAVPMLLVIAAIITFCVSPSWVFMGALIVLLLAALGLVLSQILVLLDMPADD